MEFMEQFEEEYDSFGECAQSIENPDDFELVEIEMSILVTEVYLDDGFNLKSFMYPAESYDKWGGEITPDITKVRQRRKEAAERGEVLRPKHVHVCGQCDRIFDDGQPGKLGCYKECACEVCDWPLCPECRANHKCEGPNPQIVVLEAARDCPTEEGAITILMNGFKITREEAMETLSRLSRKSIATEE
jgi:hypothetical protein